MRWTASVVGYEGMARGGWLARTAWLAACGLVLLLSVGRASAAPYWVAWEGNDYPENEGWERTYSDGSGVFGQGGAVRTLSNGYLVLDSREDVSIVDFYSMHRPIVLGPGETFVLRWGLRVDEVTSDYPFDPTIAVFAAGVGGVGFELSESSLISVFEGRRRVSFTPGVAHLFELVSSDMANYDLHVDGQKVSSGVFDPVVSGPSRVGWGDGIQGGSSLSTWGHVGFGVVPEPVSGSTVALLFAMSSKRRLWRPFT